MNIASVVTPKITLTLAGLLLLSITGNVLQYFSATTAAAECAAAAATVQADIAKGTAAAEKDRADQIAAIALDSSQDEADRLKVLDEATKRINGAATKYASAKTSAPLEPGCRASADRVEAVNAARGHQ